MVDPNVSSYSSGGFELTPQNKPRATTKAKEGELQEQTTEQPTDADTVSTSETTSNTKFFEPPTLMSYLEVVDESKTNLTQQLVSSSLSNTERAKDQHQALISLAGVTVDDDQSIDDLSDDLNDIYDKEVKIVGGLNKAIGKFNSIVKDAALNKEVGDPPTTLVDATKDLNKQIEAYNNGGDITQDELQADIEEYNSYLAEWNDEMGGAISAVNDAIDKYNAAAGKFNGYVETYNETLDECGATYQLPLLPTFPNIPSTGIPPLSTVVPDPPPDPPMDTIHKPSGVKPVPEPNTPPPSSEDLKLQMTAPPQVQYHSEIMSANLGLSQIDSQNLQETLKKLSKQKFVAFSLAPKQSHYQSSGDVQRTETPIIDPSFVAQVTEQGEVSRGFKRIVANEQLMKELGIVTQQVFANSSGAAAMKTSQLFAGENPTDRAVQLGYAVYFSSDLKNAVESGKVRSLSEPIVESYSDELGLSQKQKEKVYKLMELTVLLYSSKVVTTPFEFKGVEEQLFAESAEKMGVEFDRTPASFNHPLQQNIATGPMVAMASSLLSSTYPISEPEAVGISKKAIGSTYDQLPFRTRADLQSALSANFKAAGITNSVQADVLGSEIASFLATITPISPNEDTTVSPKFQLLEGHEQLFDDPKKYEEALSGSGQDLSSTLREAVLSQINDGETSSLGKIKSGVIDSLMNSGLSEEQSKDIANKYIEAVENDPAFAGLLELSPAKMELLRSEVDPESLLQVLTVNPYAINDPNLGRTLNLAAGVSSRIDGGASIEQLQELGLDPDFAPLVQSVQSRHQTAEQAFEQALSFQLTNGMYMGPSAAKDAASVTSFESIIDPSPLIGQLEERGISKDDATRIVGNALSIPEAYESEQTFKNVLSAFLPSGVSADAIDVGSIVNSDELVRQLGEGLGNLLLSNRTIQDELATQLKATTGMSNDQANAVAKLMEDPSKYLDLNQVASKLAERGVGEESIQQVVSGGVDIGGALISNPKRAEFVRDNLPGLTSAEFRQILEGAVQPDKLKDVIRVGCESTGASPSEAGAMAERGSTELFKVRSQAGERVWSR